MIKLDKWYLSEFVDSEHYNAHGISTGHPKLSDGTDISTSYIESLKFDSSNNRIIMLTHSKNEYELALSKINLNLFDATNDIVKIFGITELDKSECERLYNETVKELYDKVSSILGDKELYLQLSGVLVQKAFFRNSSGEIREVVVSAHIGMFTDSYLVTDWEKGEVDFRYFDKMNAIEPYHWSDGLEAIQIDNIGTDDITFLSGDNLVCESGKVTRIDKSQRGREGLFSPDAVNGKCIMPDSDDLS